MLSTIRSSNSMSEFSAATSLRDAQEEAVGELHDVRLVDGRDLAAAVAARVVEGELDDPARPRDRDRLDRDARVAVAQLAAVLLDPVDQLVGVRRALLELDAGVEVLGVLADDDQVDVVEARAHASIGLARPHLRVEVERLAQADVDRAEAAADRRRDRALERDAGARGSSRASARAAGCRRAGPSRRRRPPARPTRSSTPVASSTRLVASASSGPVPSPGISVTSWATAADSN